MISLSPTVLWSLVALTSLSGCQKSKPQSSTPQGSASATTNAVPTAGDEVLSTKGQTEAAQLTTSAPPAQDPSGLNLESTNSSAPKQPLPGALAALAATKPGGSSTFEGCLSLAADKQPTQATRSSKSETPPTWRVTALGTGALVTHTLGHACCLTGTTDTVVDKQMVTVNEHLSGNACRCTCSSTIQTRINLAAGEYQVNLVLHTNGKSTPVGSQPLKVTKLTGLVPAP